MPSSGLDLETSLPNKYLCRTKRKMSPGYYRSEGLDKSNRCGVEGSRQIPSSETQNCIPKLDWEPWEGMERLRPPKKLIKELKLWIWKLLMKQLDCFKFIHCQACVIVLAAGSDSSIIAQGDWHDTERHRYRVLVSVA
jgi:hypothetical protein